MTVPWLVWLMHHTLILQRLSMCMERPERHPWVRIPSEILRLPSFSKEKCEPRTHGRCLNQCSRFGWQGGNAFSFCVWLFHPRTSTLAFSPPVSDSSPVTTTYPARECKVWLCSSPLTCACPLASSIRTDDTQLRRIHWSDVDVAILMSICFFQWLIA